MSRNLRVMVKSGCLKRSIENFGGGRFLVKTDKTNVIEVNEDIRFMLSKTLGLPETKLELVAGENSENKIFQII